MDDFLAALGMKIRGFRKGKGLTQAELAEKADLHATYVSDIERGRARNLSVVVLYTISQVLDVELSDLMTQSSQDKEVQVLIAEFLDKLKGQNKQKQMVVLNTMRALVEGMETL